jgi:hypothetical protein
MNPFPVRLKTENKMMIYMLAVAMMLTMLIATAFALVNEAAERRSRSILTELRPLTKRRGY